MQGLTPGLPINGGAPADSAAHSAEIPVESPDSGQKIVLRRHVQGTGSIDFLLLLQAEVSLHASLIPSIFALSCLSGP